MTWRSAFSANPLRYEFVTDWTEEIVRPGDHVSFKTYPRGTSRGVVQISKRSMAVERDEHGKEYMVPALEAVTDDGTVYALYSGKGLRKLKKFAENPVGQPMVIRVKVGTLSAQRMKVVRKRKAPKIGDVFKLKSLMDPYATPIQVRCDEIKEIDGEPLYFVERW